MPPHDVASPSDRIGHEASPVICFCHLRWGFVHQRPQHLMTHAARSRRVIFWEEPWYEDPVTSSFSLPTLNLIPTDAGPLVALPLMPEGMDEAAAIEVQRQLLDQLL